MTRSSRHWKNTRGGVCTQERNRVRPRELFSILQNQTFPGVALGSRALCARKRKRETRMGKESAAGCLVHSSDFVLHECANRPCVEPITNVRQRSSVDASSRAPCRGARERFKTCEESPRACNRRVSRNHSPVTKCCRGAHGVPTLRVACRANDRPAHRPHRVTCEP